jgi:APA family basic amino acid/polyamine antiporter
VQSGKILQNIFTGSKIIALLGLIALGFILVDFSHLSENFSLGADSFNNLKKDLSGNFLKEGWEPIGGMTLLGGIAAAMVGSVFSSVAWESVTLFQEK